jgi:hypothetical protein
MSHYQYICVDYLNSNCNNKECRNYHPLDATQLDAARQEYKSKATDTLKMTRICIKYNDGKCQFNPCKFLHIAIASPVQAQPYRPVDKLKNSSARLIAAVERLQNRIKILEHASQTSGLLAIPQNVYGLLEYYIKSMDEISVDVDTNTKLISLN